MVQGLLDFFNPSPEKMQEIDPTYGVPRQFVRDAGINALGQVGALLLAAGQGVDPTTRAQLFAQIGNVGSGANADIYKAAQARLMGNQIQAAQREAESDAALRERMKDPNYLKSIGLTPEIAGTIGLKGVKEVLGKIAARDPLEAEERRRKLETDTLIRERLFGMGGSMPASGAMPGAPAPMPAQEAPSAVPGTVVNPPSAAAAPSAMGGGVPMTPEMQLLALRDPGRALQIMTEAQTKLATERARDPEVLRAEGGKLEIKNFMEKTAPAAQDAVGTLTNVYDARTALDKGMLSGALANNLLDLQRLGATLGIANPDTITNTQQFKAAIEKTVLPYLKAFGGSDTVEELRTIQRFVGSDVTLDERTLRALLDGQEKAARKAIDRYNKDRESLSPYLRTAEPIAPPPAYRLPQEAIGRIPAQAVDYLRNNPNLRKEFDKKYGTGAAATVLGE